MLDVSEQKRRIAVLLCCLAAFCEGFDIQSAGVAAAGVSRAFGPTAAALGLFFSASGAGLLCGALLGGPLSDRIGRRQVLVGSLLVYGLCSLSTAVAQGMPFLILARSLTGIGLGGAMPTVIAVVADVTAPQRRSASVTYAYAGMPFGAVAASLLVYLWPAASWRAVFVVGAVAPLALVPFLMGYLPKAARSRSARGESGNALGRMRELFAQGRALKSLALWVAFFLMAVTLHLMLNWLPLLLQARGLVRSEAALAQAVFNVVGGLVTLVVGASLDLRWRRTAIVATLVALPAALVLIAIAPPRPVPLISLAALLGAGVVAEQAIVYAVASAFYPTALRGTGLGAGVAAGRAGSLVGPMFAALLLGAGRTPSQVLVGVVPIVLVCGICVALLSLRAPLPLPQPRV